YNTVVQNKPGYATQGWSLTWTGQEFDNISISNNTMIMTAGTNVNYAVLLVDKWINGTATVANNFVDPRGIQFDFMLTNDGIAGPFNGNIVKSNDVNMVTGAYIAPPIGGTGGTPSSTLITSISTDSNVVGDLITNDNTLTLSGTAPANSA